MIVPGAGFLPGMGDPYWGSVVLLMHFDGSLDDETGRHAFTAQSGSPTYVADVFTEGLYCTSDWVACAASDAFVFSTDPFTLELIFTVSHELSGSKYVMGTSSSNAWFWVNTENTHLIVHVFGSSVDCGEINSDVRYYLAVTSPGGTGSNTVKVYLDAIQKGASTPSAQTGTTGLEIGAAFSASGVAVAAVKFDELRITKGVVRDIAIPTAPFPNY